MEITDDRLEAEYRILADPLAYTLFNPAQLRIIKAVDPQAGEILVVVVVMGNGTGKTFGLGAIWAAIMFGTANPLFAHLQDWPFAKELRVVSTTAALEDKGPIQIAMSMMFPAGRWSQGRGVGKGYYSQGKAGQFSWDVMTYNQNPKDFASHTKGAVFMSEPPSKPIFTECATRLRGGGLLFMEMTPMTYAAWVKEDLIDPGQLTLNGKKVGRVAVVRGDIHENCSDHNVGGQLPHSTIDATMALWPRAERKARKAGLFMSLAGRIYPEWGPRNEWDVLPVYHQECWDSGRVRLVEVLDPHDRKPFALTWFAVFPNDDVVAIAEWPAEPYQDFDMSPVADIEEYRALILETEKELGRTADRRLEDPNFGNTPKTGTGQTPKQMLAGPCRDCIKKKKEAECPHKLFHSDPPNAIETGHIMVRGAVGTETVRPKLYSLKDCINFRYGMEHYGYKENKDPSRGYSVAPEMIHKDFPDLVRYLYNGGLGKWWETPKPLTMWAPKLRGRRISAT